MKQGYVFWLDDIRPISPVLYDRYHKTHTVMAVKSVGYAVDWLKYLNGKGTDVYISFDHDLGEYEPDGYQLAKWIVENEFPLTGFYIHSMNPVGVKNIRQLLTHYGYKELRR